jgi:signal transduction histidine kinase/ligand-binding sensor domain-containing protein
MIRATTILIALLAFLRLDAPSPVDAQGEIRFKRVEHPAGPSHNSIFAITQDRQGFLWIGTQDGLNRFDGHEFIVYRHDRHDEGSISANRVNAVLEDSQRRLWVGTSTGIDRLDRSTGRFRHYSLEGRDRGQIAVLDLIEDGAGTIWAGTALGALRYDGDEDRWRWSLAGEPPVPVYRIREAPAGGLWLLVGPEANAGYSVWRAIDGKVTARYEPTGELGKGLDVDAGGNLWLDANGPAAVDEKTDRIATRTGARAVLVDPAVGVWAGRDGVELLRQGTTESEHSTLEGGSRGNFVVTLFRDRAGNVWAGTENGLYRHDTHPGPFRHHATIPGRPDDSSGPAVSALLEDADGVVWVATFGNGLYQLDGAAASPTTLRPVPLDLDQEAIWSLFELDGELLVGTGETLCTVAGAPPHATCAEDLRGLGFVASIARDRRGDLWLARRLGALQRRSAADGPWTTYAVGDEPGQLGSDELIHQLPDGDRIWAGTWGGDLRYFDIEAGEMRSIPRVDDEGWKQVSPILDLHRDAEGILWLATGDGLSRFDPERGTFRHYTGRDGLPGSNVYSILEDARARLWLGTNRGLARFDPQAAEGRQFRSYGAADGVVNVEFNRHARLATSDGRFLLGGLSGITEFRPGEIVDDPTPPPVALVGIEVLGEEGPRRVEPFGRDSLTLGPGDAAVSIEYVALGFADPARYRYRYQMAGVDPQWVEAGNVRVARYTSIPPGDHIFRVKAASADGAWNDEGVSLPVTVLPPFWQTWWARLGVLATMALALTAAYRLRLRRIIELEQMRLRIAGDLHDELGTELSGIALAAGRLARQEHLPESDRGKLAEVERATLQVSQGLRDIVWHVTPEHDRLDSLLPRMRSVARDLLADVDHRFRTNVGTDGGPIDMTIRRHVFLIFKELLNNVARHAAAEKVEIAVMARGGELQVEVADDGVGFDPQAARDGGGLASLCRRADEIGGRLRIDSRSGGGTRARLVAPLKGAGPGARLGRKPTGES